MTALTSTGTTSLRCAAKILRQEHLVPSISPPCHRDFSTRNRCAARNDQSSGNHDNRDGGSKGDVGGNAHDDKTNTYAFVVNSFKNLFNPKKGKWTKPSIWQRSKLRFEPRPRRRQQQELTDERFSDSLFFPDNQYGGARNRLVLRKKDFLQLFGDRSKAKLEPPWRCVFFGSDHFSVQVLQLLHGAGLSLVPGEGLLCVLDVCTQVGKKGSENPVYNYAKKHGLNVISYPIPKDRPLSSDYDVGLLASFGHLVPTRVIQSFPYGILNVHPSLLPRWRGASPCVHTILNGDTEAGVTIMQVAPKHFDIGPIVLQQSFQIPQQTPISASQLASWMAYEGGNLLLETLERLPRLIHRPAEQRSSGITYAHKIGAETGNVNWNRNLAAEIRRQFLAVGDLVGLKSVIGDLSVTFVELEIVNDIPSLRSVVEEQRKPGSHYYYKQRKLVCVRCLDGWMGFSKVKVKGKRAMSGADFQNGFLSKPAYENDIFQSLPNHIHVDIFSSRLRRSMESVARDDFLISTFGHDCLMEGRNGKRFVAVM